jgi:hypothetical protein
MKELTDLANILCKIDDAKETRNHDELLTLCSRLVFKAQDIRRHFQQSYDFARKYGDTVENKE